MRQPSLLELKKHSTPDEFAQTLREKGDLFWWVPGNFWAVTRYSLAEKVMRDPAFSCDRSSFFISRMPNLDLPLIKDFFGVISKMMIMSDGDEHIRRRKIAALGMTPELLNHYRHVFKSTVTRLIDDASRGGEMEFVQDIAEPLPSIILADLFRIPEPARKDFYRWSHNMTQFFGGASQYRNEDGIEVNESACHIRDYFAALVKERTARPQTDFLSAIIQHQKPLGISDEELVSQAVMMLVAGQITTTDQICNNMFRLLTTPEAGDRLRGNPELLKTAMEEFNRLDPAVTFLFRVVKEEVELGGETLPPGTVVFVGNHAVNRDPEVFESPEECQLDRERNPHMAYGFGPHLCLGAKLARIQMLECFGQLLERFPNLKLHPQKPAIRKHHSLAFSGFESLPLSTNLE